MLKQSKKDPHAVSSSLGVGLVQILDKTVFDMDPDLWIYFTPYNKVLPGLLSAASTTQGPVLRHHIHHNDVIPPKGSTHQAFSHFMSLVTVISITQTRRRSI
ncbi:hypothetical protein XPA_008989 [Xanthoria parietina]